MKLPKAVDELEYNQGSQMTQEGWQERVEYSLDGLSHDAAVRSYVNRNASTMDGVCAWRFLLVVDALCRPRRIRGGSLYRVPGSAEQRSQLIGG